MRTALALSLLVALAGCESKGRREARSGDDAPPAPVPNAPLRPGERPPWLPAYSPEQRALLEQNPGSPVQQPALPTYPVLDRFSYVRPLGFDPARMQHAAAAVDQRIRESRQLYVVGPVDPRLSNPIAQYGPAPPPEPDPWVRAVRVADGRYELVWALPSESARRFVDDANRALAAGQIDVAAEAFRRALKSSREVPALWVSLAGTLAARGDDAGAEQAAREALRIDPRFPDAQTALAEIHARRGDLDEARLRLARALALYPTSQRAWAVAGRIARVAERPAAPAIFEEVATSGAIQVGTQPGEPQRVYASCRAAVRYEPDFRSAMLGLPADPYQLSAGEELFCTEAMIGAYLNATGGVAPPLPAPAAVPPAPIPSTALPPAPAPLTPQPKRPAGPKHGQPVKGPPPKQPASGAMPPAPAAGPAPGAPAAGPLPLPGPIPIPPTPPVVPPQLPPTGADPVMEQVLLLARQGKLADYVLFETLGRNRPEWLRVAPDDVHETLTQYVRQFVLLDR